MKPAVWLIAAVLPAGAQPKLLTNAQVDTRPASAGLEAVFRQLLAQSGQTGPAWVGYTVPYVRTFSLGCEYVSPGGRNAPGVVHLEPPDRAVVLFRLSGGMIERVRTLSPDCEIDAGGLPVHWLTDVRPEQSVAFLGGIELRDAVATIAMHADPAADRELERLVGVNQPEATKLSAAFWIGAARGQRGLKAAKRLLASETDIKVRQRVFSGLTVSRQPGALELMIDVARSEQDLRIRRQAVAAIGRSNDPKARAFLEDVLKR
jgi:hypothetical protein